MNPVWVLVWSSAAPPSAAQQAAIRSYASARWLAVSPPQASATKPTPYPRAAERSIEAALDQARLQSASLQDGAALAAVARAKQLLRATPSLPQAAWLMAECLRVEAGIVARRVAEGGAGAPDVLWQQASALDSGRAAGFGEDPPAQTAAAPTQQISLVGSEHADLYVNGVLAPVRPEPLQLSLPHGSHHLRVLKAGLERWAAWVDVGPTTQRIEIPANPADRCSAEEFEALSNAPDRAASRAAITCERWLQARPAPGPAKAGAVQVRTCEAADCSGWVVWEPSTGQLFRAPAQVIDAAVWPDWASYLLAGAGLAAVSGFVLWQAGAFDQPAKGREGWVYRAPASLSF